MNLPDVSLCGVVAFARLSHGGLDRNQRVGDIFLEREVGVRPEGRAIYITGGTLDVVIGGLFIRAIVVLCRRGRRKTEDKKVQDDAGGEQ